MPLARRVRGRDHAGPTLAGEASDCHGNTSSDEAAASSGQDDLLRAEAQETRGHHLDRIACGVPAKHPDAAEDGHRRPGETCAGPGTEQGARNAERNAEEELVGEGTEGTTSDRRYVAPSG